MTLRTTINSLVGMLFIASAGFGIFLIVRAAWVGFTSLETGVASAVAAAAGAILLAVINLTAQRYLDRRREIEARQRDKKIDLYQNFVKLWFGVLISPESIKARAEGVQNVEKYIPELNDITQQLILWGSDGVLKSYSDFKRYISSSSQSKNHIQILTMFEDLLYEFRRDLGHNNRSLKERDILAVFINDIDKLDTLETTPPL